MRRLLSIVLSVIMMFSMSICANAEDVPEIMLKKTLEEQINGSTIKQEKPYVEMKYNLEIVSKEDWGNTSVGEYPIDVLSEKWSTLSYSEAAAACDMPIEYAETLTTNELVKYALNYPFLLDILGYDSIIDGMNHLINKSGAFKELFSRKDCYDKLLESPKYKSYGFNREENQSPDTTYWKKMFIRNFQVFNHFKNHAKGDGKNFIFQGGSQGAFQACNMAAHTGVATQCNLDVPWFCDLFAIEKEKRIRGWRPEPDNGLRYFDTAIAAKHLTCPVHITAGLGDYVCPPSGVTALYNGISSPKKLDFMQGRTHPYIPPERITFTLENE